MTWNSSPPRPDVSPGDGSQQSRIESAIGALETAIDEHDNVGFLWTGGKEAQVIADLLLYAIGGDNERSPVPFIVINTGNHFDEMYSFRQDYITPSSDQGKDTVGPQSGISDVRELQYSELLDEVINNPADPRGYHGEYGVATCPECDSVLQAVTTEADYFCDECGFEHTVPNKFRDTLPEEQWGVPESCGALKVVPMRRAIEDLGFDVLITGRRSDDPLTPGGSDEDALDVFEDKRSPVPHKRVNPLSSWKEANVYAYIKMESVSLPSLYTQQGYRHTDAKCCVDKDTQVGEYGEGGRDPEKRNAKDRLEDLGYV